MKQFFLNRLKEPSTWRGLILTATSFGMSLSPDQAYAIASLGLALAGSAGMLAPDSMKK